MNALALTNLVPGPNALEMAVHLGYCRAGWLGLLLGGVAFMVPAASISLLLAVGYVQWGSLPAVEAVFYGINPVIVAIVLFSAYRLGKSSFKNIAMAVLGTGCLAAALLGGNEAIILLGAGAAGMLLHLLPHIPGGLAAGVWMMGPLNEEMPEKLFKLWLFFLKVGALLFGSGMVLFAFIQRDVVNRFGWLSQQELIDAIAVGQMSPGPVSSSATFIGYLVAGLPGALLATLGIITPSFLIVSFLSKILPVLQRSKLVQAFLNGVTAGVVALIVSVGIALMRTAISDIWSLLIFLGACAARLFTKIDTIWLVLVGAVLGFLLQGV
ncbi:MAG: chromate efflux transporter [Anaerolineaceae bacterium]|nr:chromate efflux transporter [Anaerolineaceae bacterium]